VTGLRVSAASLVGSAMERQIAGIIADHLRATTGRSPSALLLLGGDKAGIWQRWYRDNIPLAEQLYLDYTADNEE